MPETLFEELKRYVGFDGEDEQALRALAPLASPHFKRITDVFYDRILEHEGSRKALERGESQVGHLKVKLAAWLETLLQGPWDESYYQLRCRIGHVHVRVALPQHYMFGAMNVLRSELDALTDQHLSAKPSQLRLARLAISKALDLELAIMLHTYREDILAQQGRSERLSTFGQLVGSIGHELRNPLGVMETSLFILKGRVGADERITKHLSRIEEQLALANKIISDLLDMIRDKPLNPEQVNLLEIIETAKASVSAPPGVKVSVEGTPALPAVRGDRGQLRQVFLNLFDNAVHASSPHGSVDCTVAVTQGRLRVVIQDSGPGVDDATRRRLFEPLVTTKDNGVGLGLALVKRIIERHGGTIVYDPLSTGGARFVILFPLSSELRDA